MKYLPAVGEASVIRAGGSQTRRRVVVDTPDIVAASDLAERLRGHGPSLSSNGADGCRLTLAQVSAETLRAVLATTQEWARHWDLQAVSVTVGRRSYTLGSRPKEEESQRKPRPKLLFFHAPHSGQSRRAEALLAQVLQRRHNHDTFDLVRVSADARPELAKRFGVEEVPAVVVLDGRSVAAQLGSLRHSSEIESALRPWLR